MTAATASSQNTFRFLVTTDNHLGFQEKDPRRCRDSFVTFEECLRAATLEHDVDAILLAGDLFHDSKPSPSVINKSMGLLRKYVMGNKPIAFSMLSDPAVNFPEHPVPCANFQDPNLNVAYPIFAIHGNHDDPLGDSQPSPLDMLATCGLLNHFGHCPSLDRAVVRPVLLQKGSTFIALYGLGSIHDQRLHRLLERRQVHFLRPKEGPPVAGSRWFNILLFHQNRGVRGGSGHDQFGAASKGGIPEHMLRGFGFDIVIWGNEHEQRIIPEPSDGGFDVIQPGSTIMTSISGGECNPKQYGILEVRGAQYRITPHPLMSIRPVVRRTVELWRDQPVARSVQAVEDYLRSIADQMLEEAEDQLANIPDDVLAYHPDLKFPLMRLAVDFSSPEGGPPYPQPNVNRFGQQFLDVIVNASDILKPIKSSRQHHYMRQHLQQNDDGTAVQVVPHVAQISTVDIRNKIASVFNANAKDACDLLSEVEVASAVYQFADKGDRSAIDATIDRLVRDSNKSIWKSLRKANENLAEVKEPRVRELALKYKTECTKRYVDSIGDVTLEPSSSAAAQATDASKGVSSDAAVLRDLLGVDVLSDGGASRLGMPLPKTTLGGAGSNDDDDADVDDRSAAAELERLLPKAIRDSVAEVRDAAVAAPKVEGAGDAGRPLRVDDDDDVVVVSAAPPMIKGSGNTNNKSKRGRTEAASDEAGQPPARAPRGKKAPAAATATAQAPAAPRLSLSKGPQPPAGGGMSNLLSQWTR